MLFILEKSRNNQISLEHFQFLNGANRKDCETYYLRSLLTEGRKIFKQKMDGFQGKETKVFTMRVVRYWNWLPRDAVGASSLEILKAILASSLSKLIWKKVSLPMARRLD